MSALARTVTVDRCPANPFVAANRYAGDRSAFRRLTVSELDIMLEDEEASNDVSIALWKILDVIEPVKVRLKN
jgi:hypothetical protein